MVSEQERPDLDRLLKMRLVVARVGEMDLAQWWNTKGQLGPLGAAAVRRGLPRTHYFAQARSVFAVAAHRCAEIFDPPGSVTLWRLPAHIEEAFDARWEQWLDSAQEWTPFFEQLRKPDLDLVQALLSFNAVTEDEAKAASSLSRPDGTRGVELPDVFMGTTGEIALLALGFARGSIGSLVVPYAGRGDA